MQTKSLKPVVALWALVFLLAGLNVSEAGGQGPIASALRSVFGGDVAAQAATAGQVLTKQADGSWQGAAAGGGSPTTTINLNSGQVYQINADSGLSRLAAASFALGNGTNGDTTAILRLSGISSGTAATASELRWGGTSNGIRFQSANLGLGSATVVGWSSGDIYSAAEDVGFSRLGVGSLALGNASAADTTGLLRLSALSSGTAATASELRWGATSNGIRFQSANVGLGSATVVGWSSGDIYSAAEDVGFSRLGVGSLALGNATATDVTGLLRLSGLSSGTAATASELRWGATSNGIRFQSANVGLGSGTVVAWSSGDIYSAAEDVGWSRLGVGVVALGNGSASSTAGSLSLSGLTSGGTATAAEFRWASGTTAVRILSGNLLLGSGTLAGWSSGDPTSVAVDTQFQRVGVGGLALFGTGTTVGASLRVDGTGATHGETFKIESASELLTLSTVGLTTDTTANLLPANSIILAVDTRVTTTITTTTNWAVGDATTAARFSAANGTLTSGTNQVGISQHGGSGAASDLQTAAAKVRITCTGSNPGAGSVRITVHYIQFTAPTS